MGQNTCMEQKNIAPFGVRAAGVTADKQELWKKMITTKHMGYRRMSSLIWHITHARDRESNHLLDAQTHFP